MLSSDGFRGTDLNTESYLSGHDEFVEKQVNMRCIEGVSARESTGLHNMAQPMIRILSIGDDAILLKSRTMVLRQAGYAVDSCTSWEAIELLGRESFDVVLVCRSVALERGLALAAQIHSSWGTRVIRLAPRTGEADSPFDFAIDMAAGPASFLRVLGNVIAGRSSPESPN